MTIQDIFQRYPIIQGHIAAKIGMPKQSFSNKLNGVSRFTLSEIMLIQKAIRDIGVCLSDIQITIPDGKYRKKIGIYRSQDDTTNK